MRNLHIILFIIFMTGFVGCHKETDMKTDQIPIPVQSKIDELILDQNLCSITEVTVIEYKGKQYYHIYSLIWSCMYCQLFDEKGERPNFSTSEWTDFLANKKDIQRLPACSGTAKK